MPTIDFPPPTLFTPSGLSLQVDSSGELKPTDELLDALKELIRAIVLEELDEVLNEMAETLVKQWGKSIP